MSDYEPATDLEDFACVDEYQAIEQPEGHTTHHVVFWDQLTQMYAQLLDVIRQCGYEVVAFAPNANNATDEYYEQFDDLTREEDTRISATFIEKEPEPFYHEAFTWDDPPEWVDDMPV